MNKLNNKLKALFWVAKVNFLYWKLMFYAYKTRKKLSLFKDAVKGEDVFCIGNGPSLLTEDITKLNGKNVLLTNRAYLLLDKFKPSFKAVCLQDYRRIEEVSSDIENTNLPVFFTAATISFVDNIPVYLKRGWNYVPSRFSLVKKLGVPAGLNFDFSPDIPERVEKGIFLSTTVIFFAIQLAYYLGAKRIYLLGVDMNYNSNSTHFTDKSVHYAPQFTYEKDAKPYFQAYHKFLKNKGIELIDCTTNGRIDVLPKSSLAIIS